MVIIHVCIKLGIVYKPLFTSFTLNQIIILQKYRTQTTNFIYSRAFKQVNINYTVYSY